MMIFSAYIFTLLHVIFIFFTVLGLRKKVCLHKDMAWAYYPAIIWKVSMGLCFGLIYQFYYFGGDTFLFFEDSVTLGRLIETDIESYGKCLFYSQDLPLELHYTNNPRALYFAKFLSPLAWFTGENYWTMTIYLCTIGFYASWWFCQILVKYFHHAEATCFAFLFYPSFVFWSSGIVKECMAIALMMVLCAIAIGFLFKSFNGRELILGFIAFLLAGTILWQLKYYYAAVLIPLIFTLLISYRWKVQIWVKMMVGSVAASFLVLITAFLHPNLQFNRILYALVSTHDIIMESSMGSATIQYNSLTPTWGSVLENFPLAIFSGLFRPLFGDGNEPLQIIAQMENGVLLVGGGLAFFFWVKDKKSIVEKQLVLTMLVYIFILAGMMALSSPNFGTLMRYKAIYLPFLVYLIGLGFGQRLPGFSFKLRQYLKKIWRKNSSESYSETALISREEVMSLK